MLVCFLNPVVYCQFNITITQLDYKHNRPFNLFIIKMNMLVFYRVWCVCTRARLCVCIGVRGGGGWDIFPIVCFQQLDRGFLFLNCICRPFDPKQWCYIWFFVDVCRKIAVFTSLCMHYLVCIIYVFCLEGAADKHRNLVACVCKVSVLVEYDTC